MVGLVGALGALGGAFMPTTFAWLKGVTGNPQSMFWVVFAVTAVSMTLLQLAVAQMRRDERRRHESTPLETGVVALAKAD